MDEINASEVFTRFAEAVLAEEAKQLERKSAVIAKYVAMADDFDAKGLHQEADEIDALIQKYANLEQVPPPSRLCKELTPEQQLDLEILNKDREYIPGSSGGYKKIKHVNSDETNYLADEEDEDDPTSILDEINIANKPKVE